MIIKRQQTDVVMRAWKYLPVHQTVKTTPKEVEEITLDSPEGHSQTDDMISFGVDDMEHTNRPDHKPIPKTHGLNEIISRKHLFKLVMLTLKLELKLQLLDQQSVEF